MTVKGGASKIWDLVQEELGMIKHTCPTKMFEDSPVINARTATQSAERQRFMAGGTECLNSQYEVQK